MLLASKVNEFVRCCLVVSYVGFMPNFHYTEKNDHTALKTCFYIKLVWLS